MVHGVGDQKASFHESWKDEILRIFPELKDTCEFQGLEWESARDRIQAKYPLIQENFSSVLAAFNLASLQAVLDNESYKLVMGYVMDVLVYVGLPDMTLYLQKLGLERLDALAKGREGETLIIAHSLGAALMPHVLWYLYQFTAAIPYHSLILLASPLAFTSPPLITVAVPSMLDTMGKLSGETSRTKTLEKFAKAWLFKGANRLHFLANDNDIVCSDVQFPFAGKQMDIIPVRQGFDDPELKALTDNNPGCYHPVSFGKPQINSIGDNHDVVTYIRQPVFTEIMKGLLKA